MLQKLCEDKRTGLKMHTDEKHDKYVKKTDDVSYDSRFERDVSYHW